MHNIEKTINSIGAKIKYYRVLNKISLTKLSNDANISKSTLFGLEEGHSNPTISTLINIANTLNISLNELIDSQENKKGSLNLLFISDDEKYKLYKLILSPNELFEFNRYTEKMSIQVLEGGVKLIDNSISLYQKDSIDIGFNKVFKAYNEGAIILFKIYEVENSYQIKEDFYADSTSLELLEDISLQNYTKLISRVIFKKANPIEIFEPKKYINYVEILEDNQENHYYIFKRYIGIDGSIKNLISKLSNKYSLKYENLKTFIDLSINRRILKKSDYSLLNKSVTLDIKDIIIESVTDKYKDIVVLNNLNELLDIKIKENCYYLLIDELITSNINSQKLSIIISIYRIFENIIILDERELDTQELTYYNLLISNIPKALYFAYCDYIDLAIYYLNNLYKKINSIDNSSNSKLIEVYKKLAKDIEQLLKNSSVYNSIETTEYIIKDLNLHIEVKELISPVIENSGLYCYLLKS